MKKKRGFGPRVILNGFEKQRSWAERLSQKPAEAKLKAAARAIARNKAAVKAEAKAVILRQKICRNRKIIRYKVNFWGLPWLFGFNNISIEMYSIL